MRQQQYEEALKRIRQEANEALLAMYAISQEGENTRERLARASVTGIEGLAAVLKLTKEVLSK